MPWPPVPNEPYIVEDMFGEFLEVVADGALDQAKLCAGTRVFRVAEDSWNEDFSQRTILRVELISAA